jgi:hypothetical protein
MANHSPLMMPSHRTWGHRTVVPQRELAAYGLQYVTFKTFTKTFNGRKVMYAYRDITVLLEFYLPQMLGSFNKKMGKIFVILFLLPA